MLFASIHPAIDIVNPKIPIFGAGARLIIVSFRFDCVLKAADRFPGKNHSES